MYIRALLKRFLVIANIKSSTAKKQKPQNTINSYLVQTLVNDRVVFLMPVYVYLLYLLCLEPSETKRLLNVRFDKNGIPDEGDLDTFYQDCFNNLWNWRQEKMSDDNKAKARSDLFLCLIPEKDKGMKVLIFEIKYRWLKGFSFFLHMVLLINL